MKKVLFFVVVVIFVFSVSAGFSFQTELVRVGGDKMDKVLVLVDKNIFPDIQSELDTYLDSLEKEWSYECWKIEVAEQIEEIRGLKRFILQRWEASGVGIFGVFGVFFIDGENLPLVHAAGFWGPLPTEAYWMDIDSQEWEMWEYDGKVWIGYKKTNDFLPLIFASRIRSGNVEDLKGYLKKVTEYHKEEYQKERDDGIFYCDDGDEDNEYIIEGMRILAKDGLEIIDCGDCCEKHCFLNTIKKEKKWMNLWWGTAGRDDGQHQVLRCSGELVSVSEIRDANPKGRFFWLSQNSINYDVSNYLGSAYLFTGRGIVIFGGTELWHTEAYPRLFRVLKKGLPIGEAQRIFVEEIAGLDQGFFLIPMHGYVLAGDPTIVPNIPPPVRAIVETKSYHQKLWLKAEVESITYKGEIEVYLRVKVPKHSWEEVFYYYNGREWTKDCVPIEINISPGERIQIVPNPVPLEEVREMTGSVYYIWEFEEAVIADGKVLDYDKAQIRPLLEIN